MTRRAAAAMLLAATSAMLMGCVAAVVPIAAGAALVKRHGDLERRTAAPRTAPAATPATAPVPPAGTLVRTELTALPAPSGTAATNAEVRTIASFSSYANAALDAGQGRVPRESALLTRASELRPQRAQCAGTPPAVFVDLDPGKDSFDPLAAHDAAPTLPQALSALRGRGVTIVWFSRLGENFAAATREALAQSGLDPAGADRLVLMRDIAERKQTRRDQLAASLCPIAMLGDERADFDELYLYLRDADAAVALDAMIGRGWFLVPPLTPAKAPAA